MNHPGAIPARRWGMTLIELLVVVAIVGVLAILLLSAVQAARQASRRSQCLNNLRQIGLAIQGYHGNVNCFPPGRVKTYDPRYRGDNYPCSSKIIDKSFLVHLLPYLEQPALFNAVNHDLSILGGENSTIWPVGVGVFACPSDPGAGTPRLLGASVLGSYGIPGPPAEGRFMAYTSYSGCFGSLNTYAIPIARYNCKVTGEMLSQNNGCFNDLALVTFASVRDGLSQTIAVAEKATDTFRSLDDPGSGTTEFDRHGWYVTGNFGDTLFTGMYPPNASKTMGRGDGTISSASSYHPGGLNVVMADGSARFIKETIQSWASDPRTDGPAGAQFSRYGSWGNLPPPGVWQALCTRSGRESVSAGEF